MEQLHCRNSYCSHNFVGECNVMSCTTGWTDHLNGQEHEELQGFALKYVNISSYQFHVLNGRNVDIHSDKGTAAVDYAIENVSILVVSPSVLLTRIAVKVLVCGWSYFTLFNHKSSSLVWKLDFQLHPTRHCSEVLGTLQPCSPASYKKAKHEGCSNTTVFIVRLSSKISLNLKHDQESSVQK